MKVIYLVFVLLAGVVATSVTENSTSLAKERNSTTTLLRKKRTFTYKMTSAVVTLGTFQLVAAEVGTQIRYALHGSGKDVNVKAIDEFINKNLKETNPFKKLLENNPSWKQHIIFQATGLECTKEFCKKYGNDFFAFGLCSKDLCRCNFGEAEKFACREGLVYDPTYRDCDSPRNVNVCGGN